MAQTQIRSGQVLDGTIVNADISASAAIAYSKLNLTDSIVSGDLTSGAKQGALESKLYPSHVQVDAFTALGFADDISTELDAATSVDTVRTDFTTGKGQYLATIQPISLRKNSDENPIDDGSGNRVYGKLTNQGYSSGLSNITGVTVEFTGHDATSGQNLVYTHVGTTLAWDGGAAVDVGTNGTYVLLGTGGVSAGEFIVVTVVAASLPGSDQTDALTFAADKYIGYFSNVAGTMTPYTFTSTDIDVLAIEIFDLYSVTAEALLNGIAFGDIAGEATHNHDDRYFTETELGSTVSAIASGASKIGVFDEFDNSNSTNVQDVLDDLDAAITSSATGDITAVTAGSGMTGGGVSGDVTLNVIGGTGITANADDVAIDLTAALAYTGTHTFSAGGINTSGAGAIQIGSIDLEAAGSSNSTAGAYKIGVYAAELDNSASGNVQDVLDDLDAAITSAAGGDIEGVTAGSGMTGGGTTGTVTLNVIGGTGITANADDIAIDLTAALTYTGVHTYDTGGGINVTGGTLQIDSISLETPGSSNTTSGAYKIGVYDEFDNSANTNIQAVLNDLDTAITSAAGGDIAGVTAGAGLTGGGTSGTVTLDVGAGNGISVAADSVALDLTYSPTWSGTHTFSNAVVAPNLGTWAEENRTGVTTATWVLSNTPATAKGPRQVFCNGIRLREGAGNDYTIAAATITFLITLLTTDLTTATYAY
jgi:hypothetical protein